LRTSEKFFQRNLKKRLTNGSISDIIEKLSEGTRTSGHSSEKVVQKFFGKKFQKGVDKQKEL